jgi:two-component system response regulator LytT
MKALVVDDEPLVRSELVYALGRVAEDLDVTEAESAVTALALLAERPFDVIFLDIGLPDISGLEAMTVIKKLPHPPVVVFVTAYDEHALQAFELAATDYVVKPVSEARLAQTVARVRAQIERKPASGDKSAGRIPLERDERTLLVRIDDANGHLVTAQTFDQSLRFRGSLGEAAARLEPHGFLRVHRSYLVNPEHVVEVTPFFGGSYVLRVDDKARSEVPVSRGYFPVVKKAFGL